MISSFSIDVAGRRISQSRGLPLYLALALFYMLVIYSASLKIAYWKRLDVERQPIARGVAVLNIIFLPGLVYDLHLFSTRQVLAFTPLFYCVSSTLVTLHVAKRYFTDLRLITATEVTGEYLDKALVGTDISPREKDIINLMLKGLSNKDIAHQLCISLNTVKTHNRNIFGKMGVKSRFELAMKLRNNPEK
jgi:DNA-binding CsgD family transcriptional regulator